MATCKSETGHQVDEILSSEREGPNVEVVVICKFCDAEGNFTLNSDDFNWWEPQK